MPTDGETGEEGQQPLSEEERLRMLTDGETGEEGQQPLSEEERLRMLTDGETGEEGQQPLSEEERLRMLTDGETGEEDQELLSEERILMLTDGRCRMSTSYKSVLCWLGHPVRWRDPLWVCWLFFVCVCVFLLLITTFTSTICMIDAENAAPASNRR